jgi:hypothetical protein
MSPLEVEQFAQCLLADNSLAAQSVAAGESLPLAEVIELAAEARALYNVATLVTAELDGVEDCHSLWLQTRDQFQQLCAAWSDVPEDGELLNWHRLQLQRLATLATDRVELYCLANSDRRRLLVRRAADV